MRKFKLKKELPGCPVGTIGDHFSFADVHGGPTEDVIFSYTLCAPGYNHVRKHVVSLKTVLEHPEFFEEIIEQKPIWTDDDMIEFARETYKAVKFNSKEWDSLKGFFISFKSKRFDENKS
jgi:hypothetical protein